ncbi:MAG: pilin [Firmicutes bacterium]|nr:pilin [Bacillota bacterium]
MAINTTPPSPGAMGAQLAIQIRNIANPILFVLAGLGALFAIYLGVRLATAQDDGKRKEAKQQLVYALIGVVIILGLLAVFNVVMAVIIGGPVAPVSPI